MGEERLARMDRGLLALVGVEVGDTPANAAELARKLVGLRLFADARGRMERSLGDVGGTLGVVSQFTLLADARKGRRPSFAAAEEPDAAQALVERLIAEVRALDCPVVGGRFGASMRVRLENDGPVTVLLDTRKRF